MTLFTGGNESLRLNEVWIKLIMSCVSIVSYSILVNGKSGTQFTLSRGLRQRDSLSPFLFLICAKGLSFLISNAKQEGELKGFTITKGDTSISHFLFVNDNIMFCKQTKEEWDRVKAVLNIYERGLGQVINNPNSLSFSAQIRWKKSK